MRSGSIFSRFFIDFSLNSAYDITKRFAICKQKKPNGNIPLR